MKITTEPRSDQWNAEDFIGGPRTFTIAGVKVGSAEQKYDIELVEGEGRSWRPPLTVLRLLVAAWSDDATTWIGRRVRLYRDPEISFGRDKVGGIRVSHLSHIDKPLSIMLTATRGKRANHTVQPLTEAPVAPALTEAMIACCVDIEQLGTWWKQHPDQRVAIESRVAEIKAADAEAGA